LYFLAECFWYISSMKPIVCEALQEVRAHIDRIDHEMVALIAERGRFVKQAARFKKTSDDVKAPQRVEQVVVKVRALAEEFGADASVVERVWRALIAGFIEAELVEHTTLGEAPK
jgi:isochorismate pyruvate lyase